MVKNVVDSQRLECNRNDNVRGLIFRHKMVTLLTMTIARSGHMASRLAPTATPMMAELRASRRPLHR